MITFKQTMDPCSLDVCREEGPPLAVIQWHPERPPRLVVQESFSEFTFVEVQQIVRELGQKTRTGTFPAPTP